MSMFDRMQDRRDDGAASNSASPPSPSNGGSFKIMFGTEECTVAFKQDQKLKDVFRDKAEPLGLDYDRRLAYRDNEGNILSGEETPVAGREYIAAITHDSKGC